MYSYVTDKVVKPCKLLCNDRFRVFQDNLDSKYHLKCQVALVGSGKHKLVTRLDDEPFDLDYNLIFHRLPGEYMDNPGRLKRRLRSELDVVMRGHGFSNGQDSTSAITYQHMENGTIDFGLDIGIILSDKNSYHRLIQRKGSKEDFVWNQIRDSRKAPEHATLIREKGYWNQLQDQYLQLKNEYGSSKDHPSFTVFSEAVNLVWQSLPKEVRKG